MRFWIGFILGLLIGTGGTMAITQDHIIGAFNRTKEVVEDVSHYTQDSGKIQEIINQNQKILQNQ